MQLFNCVVWHGPLLNGAPTTHQILSKRRRLLFRFWLRSKLSPWRVNDKRMSGAKGRGPWPGGHRKSLPYLLPHHPGFQMLQLRSQGPQAPL